MHAVNVVERQICRYLVNALLKAGYIISVCDGEETTLEKSTSAAKIFKAMFTTDEDILYVYQKGEQANLKRAGWIKLIYGNDGFDVINDYTTNLKLVLEDDVQKYVDRLEKRGY